MNAGAPTTDGFNRLVDRLNVASTRTKQAWPIAVADKGWDGSSADAAFRGLSTWDPLRSFEPLDTRTAGTNIGLRRALAFYAVGIDLERILSIGLAHLMDRFPPDHPARTYIVHEMREEAEHTAMFEWFTRLAGPDVPRHTSISTNDITRISELGRTNPAAFLLYVICGELMFDRVQRASLQCADTHPLVAEINRIHVVEEARHLSFAKSLLGEYLRDADPRLRKRLTYEAPVVARWTSVRVIDMPSSLYRSLGTSDDEIAEAGVVVQRSALHRRCITDIHTFCRSVGIVDARLDGAWRSSIDRKGES